MRIGTLIIVILVCFGCKNWGESKLKTTKSDRFELLPEPDKAEKEKYLKNLNLISFLETPIDLQKFKIRKDRNVTTSVTNGMEYHFNPKLSDSLFYNYYYHFKNVSHLFSHQITVFKFGQNKHSYDDKTEHLIELDIRTNDIDLGKANLVGLAKTELESEFGADHLNFENGIAYSDKNKVLILELENSKVKSYRYIKLNTTEIDVDLIEKTIE